jgi:hypothetical protein
MPNSEGDSASDVIVFLQQKKGVAKKATISVSEEERITASPLTKGSYG